MLKKLIDLLKILHPRSNPWQMSLTICLGIFLGLTPLLSAHNAVVFVLAFVLNINITLLVASIAAFSALSLPLSGVFESFGHFLLQHPSLQGLWTDLYNTTGMRATNFNNTLVLGSLSSAIIVSAPTFILSLFAIRKYQTTVDGIYQKVAGWFKIIANTEHKKASIFRPVRVLVAGIATGGLVAGVAYCLDPFLQQNLQLRGSQTVQAELGMDVLRTKLFEQKVEIDKFYLANRHNKLENLFEVDRLQLSIDTSLLLERKLVIRELTAEGLRLQQPRQTPAQDYSDGLAPLVPPVINQTVKSWRDMLKMDIADPKAILQQERENLKTTAAVNSAKTELEQMKAKWQQKLKGVGKEKIAEHQQAITALQQKTKKLNPTQVPQMVEEGKKLVEKIEGSSKEIKNLQTELVKDKERVRELLRNIEKASAEDYEYLKKKYVPSSSNLGIIEALLPPEQIEQLRKTIAFYQQLRSHLPLNSKKTAPGTQQTLKVKGIPGEFVLFAEQHPCPNFLLEHAAFSMVHQGDTIQCKIENLSSDPFLLNKTITISASTEQAKLAANADWTIQPSNDKITDELKIQIKNWSPENLVLAEGISLPNSKMDISCKLFSADDTITGEITIAVNEANWQIAADESDKAAQLLQSVLSKITSFSVGITLQGQPSSLSWSVRSDLDQAVAKQMTQIVGDQAKKFQDSLGGLLQQQSAGSSNDVKKYGQEHGQNEKLLQGQNAELEKMQRQVQDEFSLEKLRKKALPF